MFFHLNLDKTLTDDATKFLRMQVIEHRTGEDTVQGLVRKHLDQSRLVHGPDRILNHRFIETLHNYVFASLYSFKVRLRFAERRTVGVLSKYETIIIFYCEVTEAFELTSNE